MSATETLGRSLAAHGRWCRRHPLGAALLWLSLLCLLLMGWVDHPLALWIKAEINPRIEAFFQVVTDLGKAGWWILLPLVAALGSLAAAATAFRVEDHQRWRQVARSWLFMLVVALSSGLLITVLKQVIGRERPRVLFQEGAAGFAPLSFSGANSSIRIGLVFEYDL